MPSPAVILLSGGLDSATALAVATRDGGGGECHTLAIDYGQRHRHELAAAARVSVSLNAASHKVIALDLRAFGGSALTANLAVPKDRTHAEMSSGGGSGGAGGIPITYVPARNLIFLSLATAYAETLNARDIYIGVNAVDYSGYPDCRPEFIRAFEHAANLGTRAGSGYRHAPRGEPSTQSHDSGFRIRAPLVNLTKADIIRLGLSLGVNYALTHSCYDPIPYQGHPARDPAWHGLTARVLDSTSKNPDPAFLACGRCDSCQLRRDGFRAAGVPDPTSYAPMP